MTMHFRNGADVVGRDGTKIGTIDDDHVVLAVGSTTVRQLEQRNVRATTD